MVKQYGLAWKEVLFGSEPYWTVEPKSDVIESIVRKHLRIEPDRPCQVHFYTQGAFNKLYKVDTDKGTFLMRVSLPVDPHYKTTSEIATIDYMREEIGIPVPGIIAFDESTDNDLEFEWILMELMPGQPLRRKWRKMAMGAKEDLIKQLASYQAKLFEKRFDGIGSIYKARKEEPAGPQGVDYTLDSNHSDPPKPPFTLGRIVSMMFFWDDHLSHDIPRGPFRNSHDWLHARLTLTINDQERILKESDDEDEIEDAENAKDCAQRLLKVLPSIFPPTEPVESTILFHDDLSRQNILVDESGKLTAIVDWECVSTLPLWRACQIPHLLEGRDRYEKPQREIYPSDEDPEDSLDNEGVGIHYWEHLMEYEQTRLRDLFISEMGRLQPLWLEESKKGALKVDFEIAVHNSDVWGKRIQQWLNAYDSGEPWSLREKFLE
ncbi:hypothetical protein FQN50_002106 [Emmonsiellopsis sp. PD_5]|nr:hypothetical protein FQN50_002106 [Emmonsiellopsis sp. PD_5]